jgi:hypothetical protein
MRKRYKHRELGGYRKLGAPKGGAVTSLVWDAELAGLADYLTAASKQPGRNGILILLEAMLELNEIEPPEWTECINEPMLVERKGRRVPNPLLRDLAPEKYERELHIDKLQAVIDRELAPFQFRSQAKRLGEKGQWVVMWRITPEKPPKLSRGIMQMDAGMGRTSHKPTSGPRR